jgi:hypothetical protein
MFNKILLVLTCIINLVALSIGCSSNNDVMLDQLAAQPDKYIGKTVTVEGFYFAGFEIVVLCGELVPSDYYPGNLAPAGKLVWLEGSMPADIYSKLYLQSNNVTGYPAHYGKVKITGIFQTGSFGHLNAYQYKITIKNAELLTWSPSNLTTGNLKVLVTDDAGNPLKGAKVVSDSQPEGQLKVTGLTGDDGTVTFNDIKAGNYTFYVSRFDYTNIEFPIVVAAGQTATESIKLKQ